MADRTSNKRSREVGRAGPAKKRKIKPPSTGGYVDKDGKDFQPVSLADSDSDHHNGAINDTRDIKHPTSGSKADVKRLGRESGESTQAKTSDNDFQSLDGSHDDATSPAEDHDEEDEDEADEGHSTDSDDESGRGPHQKAKAKRNDPAAFATSMSKILSTKLSKSRRADPVLARSSDAHQAAKAAVDQVLESKARKQLRLQRKEALERGRVKDVLGAEAEETTADILETERRLRKVAQRGVVKLFNAVRVAQVRASEAERANKTEGIVGAARKSEKVSELSKKGFLDLIASGGGALRNRPIGEA